jgi:hypothetical protein
MSTIPEAHHLIWARARAHGRADARQQNWEHAHLYPNGVDGCADYWLGRQDIEMAGTEASALIVRPV